MPSLMVLSMTLNCLARQERATYVLGTKSTKPLLRYTSAIRNLTECD